MSRHETTILPGTVSAVLRLVDLSTHAQSGDPVPTELGRHRPTQARLERNHQRGRKANVIDSVRQERDGVIGRFHPLIQDWFVTRFGEPTAPQRDGWPAIADGHNTLIAAPTGSGKTLAAFLVPIDRLVRQWADGTIRDEIDTVYVSPLRALSNDIDRNLQQPLNELREAAESAGLGKLPIRTALRTGDTTSSQRQAMLRRPPHLLVTTPESLYLLLTSVRGRERLATVRTVIVDEIHALARDKRGSHLSLTLERLAAVCDDSLVRIGLSATQKPIKQIASFLVGADHDQADSARPPNAACANSQMPQSDDRAIAADVTGVPPEPHANSGGECDGDAPAASSLFPSPSCRIIEPMVDDEPASRACTIVDAGHVRDLDLAIELPPSDLAAVCTHEQWAEVYQRLIELIESHRSTLIFVNTRRLAERVAHGLRDMLGEEAVASHHGSLSKSIRLDVEQRLKDGQLRAIVATASLELGIDIGMIDLVCQIGSPRSIATFLQRIGRSGHSLGTTPKGRLFPLTRDELLEAISLVRAVRAHRLDAIEIPMQPIDILAQQIIAEVSQEEWAEELLYERFRRAWPYRRMTVEQFGEVVGMVSEGVNRSTGRGAHVHRDRINGLLRGRRSAKIVATNSGGAIPETAEYRVVTEDGGVVVGSVDEDFAIESTAGSVFLLGNNSWQVIGLLGGDMLVADAHGMPPNIPFWFGEAPGRTVELSEEVSRLRQEIADRLMAARPDLSDNMSPEPPDSLAESGKKHQTSEREDQGAEPPDAQADDFEEDDPYAALPSEVIDWLASEGSVVSSGAQQAVLYVATQVAAVGLVPTSQAIVFERFFDESGGTQLVIHAPLGGRINRAWGLALRKRFCRSFDFELQAAADDDGVVLSLGPQHSLPIENLFTMLRPDNGQYLVEQAMLAVPFFQVRWRWNVTRALAVQRRNNGKKVPPHLQRFRSDDLLASAFPETVGCLENHHGDVEIPDHPLVVQTMRDCLTEATDITRFNQLLDRISQGDVALIPRETTEPSPFSHELLNANPYAFLDDAPLEERRSRAVATRRTLSTDQMRDLGQLDRDALNSVVQQAWPTVRDADELHDVLLSFVVLDPLRGIDWQPHFHELVTGGRATIVTVSRAEQKPNTATHSQSLWVACEQLPIVRAAFESVRCDPPVVLPPELERDVSRAEARVAIVRGAIAYGGPTTVDELSGQLGLEPGQIQSALEALEGEGVVMRGHYTDHLAGRATQERPGQPPLQWCDRRLLARIHQQTMRGLREQIRPVPVNVFVKHLLRAHRLAGDHEISGPAGVREAVSRLQGFELASGAWESQVLESRLDKYDPAWLDELLFSGELIWGRVIPPGPRRSGDEDQPASKTSFNRNTPVALMSVEGLDWLLPPPTENCVADDVAERVDLLEALRRGGAQFANGLARILKLPQSRITELLSELAAMGLASGDSFALIRAKASRQTRTRGAPTGHRTPRVSAARQSHSAVSNGGRWSAFPPLTAECSHEKRIEEWCRQLLNRYGVVFREILTRETAAPRWYELQNMFRRMEMRGEIRGGRFIDSVGGEQFALGPVVTELRELRNRSDDFGTIVLSAADPINLVGILDSRPRLAASPKNALLIRNGQFVAVRNGVDVEFLIDVSDEQRELDRKQLLSFGLPKRAKEIRDQRLRRARA